MIWLHVVKNILDLGGKAGLAIQDSLITQGVDLDVIGCLELEKLMNSVANCLFIHSRLYYRPGQDNWEFWLWKFSNFSAVLILHLFCWIQRVKTVISTILEATNIDFLGISLLKISKNSKFRAAQTVIMTVLELLNDQNWFHIKSEWQKNPEISTLCISD